jgi:hypothetical protein
LSCKAGSATALCNASFRPGSRSVVRTIHPSRNQQIGFVAQEVESVFGEWVEIDSDGIRTLSMKGFEAHAVESIREIKAMSDQLSSQLSQLQASLRSRRL